MCVKGDIDKNGVNDERSFAVLNIDEVLFKDVRARFDEFWIVAQGLAKITEQSGDRGAEANDLIEKLGVAILT